MTDHDDLLTEIGSDLQVETSREFAVGVRARVDEARRRTRRTRWAFAAAASIGLVSILVWRPSVRPAATATLTPEPASPLAVASPKPEIVVPDHANVGRVAPQAPKDGRATLAPAEPRLEVITNQREVLRALWASYAGKPGTLVVGDTETVESSSARPILVESIVVPSIVVKEIGNGSGTKETK